MKQTIALLCVLAWMAVPSLRAAPPTAFAAAFVQTHTLPGFEQPIISHGELHYSRSEGFRWEITKPYHYRFEMHDGLAREQLPDGTQRSLRANETPWLKVVQQVFVHALAGDSEQMARYFQQQIEPLEHGRRVTLVPNTEVMTKVIRRIEVTEAAPGRPQRMRIDEASGGRLDIRFTPLAPAPEVP